jgi:hypothetical protein
MLIGSVVWAGEIGVVWGKSRISTRNRKNTEMTVPISWAGEIGVVWGKSRISTRNRKNTEMTVPISLFGLGK